MPTDIYTFSNAAVNHLLDNWEHSPVTRAGMGGFDLTGVAQGDLFALQVPFIEVTVHDAAHAPAGINYQSGTKTQGFIDINIYTPLDTGDAELVRLAGLLYSVYERKRINEAQVRPALRALRPYEYRGKLCKSISFPFEFFSGPVR